MTKSLKRIKLLQRWSPLLFALAIVILIISASYRPLSLSYLIRALIMGSGFSVLTIAYWRWELKYPSRLIWLALTVVLIMGGFYWSKDQTFGIAPVSGMSWILAAQFMSTAFGVFFGVLVAIRTRLIGNALT